MGGNHSACAFNLYQSINSGTASSVGIVGICAAESDNNGMVNETGFQILASPSTTSSTRYEIYMKNSGTSGKVVYINHSPGYGTIGQSTLLAMEIGA
jgi:hypothetical protein